MKNITFLKFKRLVLFTLISLFYLSKDSFASPPENKSFWQKRQKYIENVFPERQNSSQNTFQRLLDPLKIKIPEEFGTVVESHRGSNGRLIIHIQDAHANFEGQMNLANILEALIKDYNLKLILVEGGNTDADFTYLRERAPLEERKERAEKLLKDGIISGEEYLNIASDYPMAFQGIEDRTLYDKNLEAMSEIDRFKDIALEYVEGLINVAEKLKLNIYNKKLLELDRKKKDYISGKNSLIEYYEYLSQIISNSNIIEDFPEFKKLIKAVELEKKIDLEKIEVGKAGEEEIAQYKEYIEASKDLDVNKIFKEESRLEAAINDLFCENHDQKTLVRTSKDLSILKNLLNIKVVPEEYQYFLENESDFNPTEWANFLKVKVDFYRLSLKISNNFYVITDNLNKIEEFYNIADERNRVFLRKTEERMNKDNTKIAALITGGFHTSRITQLLADSGYSYVVISPKVTTETDDVFYRSTLKRQWLPER